MENSTPKQPKIARISRRKMVIIIVAALGVVGIGIAVVLVFMMQNSPQKILTDSIVNSLALEKTKFTLSYSQATGSTGLKSAELDGSYVRANGYAANANAIFGQGDYQVSIKGRVAIDRSSKVYYIYDTVDDGLTANKDYRMTADSQRAVADNFKEKWTTTDADVIGEGSSCMLRFLQRAQNDPPLARALMQAITSSNAISIRTESTSGDTAVYAVTVASDTSNPLAGTLKETKQYAGIPECNTGATEAIADGIKNASLQVSIDTKRRLIKNIAIETKAPSGVNKMSVTIASDESAKVSIPKDAKSVQGAQ